MTYDKPHEVLRDPPDDARSRRQTVFNERGVMRALLSVLSVITVISVVPTGASAWQVAWGGPAPSSDFGDLSCMSDDGRCDDPHITLQGRMDLRLLPEGAIEDVEDVAGVLVGCWICTDGNCGPDFNGTDSRVMGPAIARIEWPGGEENRFNFETRFQVNGRQSDRQFDQAPLLPDAFNSYYCGLWLWAGFEFTLMPGAFYNPSDVSSRWALAESGAVVELTGSLR